MKTETTYPVSAGRKASNTSTISIAIMGASGYSGAELLRCALNHPALRVAAVFAEASAGRSVAALYPDLRSRTDLVYQRYSAHLVDGVDIVLLAMPSGEAMQVVPDLLQRGIRVIDLGGDFRLQDTNDYMLWYNRQHTAPEFLPEAVYGLPEWNHDAIATARLVANPGCYPTSAILPLAPLLRAGIIEPEGITICSMSGTSGAGRASAVEYSHTEMVGNARAYRVGTHQHVPEITGTLAALAGVTPSITFVPHLIPVSRGIYTSITAELVADATPAEVAAALAVVYAHAPFVRLLGATHPELRGVVGTNFCDIGFTIDRSSRRVVLTSAIDNLLKGAAGQAIQNLNIMNGLEQTEGL